jgi:hypothetical protein
MARYWIFMLVLLGALLVYAYYSDPCIGLVRGEFQARHPDWELVATDAESGSPESVRCVVSYRAPESRDVKRVIWWYRNDGGDWALFKVLDADVESPEPSAPPDRPRHPSPDQPPPT